MSDPTPRTVTRNVTPDIDDCTSAALAEPRHEFIERIRRQVAAGQYETTGRVEQLVDQLTLAAEATLQDRPWTIGDVAELHQPSGVYKVEVLDHAYGYGIPAVRVRVIGTLGPVDPTSGLVVGTTGTFSAAKLKPVVGRVDA